MNATNDLSQAHNHERKSCPLRLTARWPPDHAISHRIRRAIGYATDPRPSRTFPNATSLLDFTRPVQQVRSDNGAPIGAGRLPHNKVNRTGTVQPHVR